MPSKYLSNLSVKFLRLLASTESCFNPTVQEWRYTYEVFMRKVYAIILRV